MIGTRMDTWFSHSRESQAGTLCGQKGALPLLIGGRFRWLRSGTTGSTLLPLGAKKGPKGRMEQNDGERLGPDTAV